MLPPRLVRRLVLTPMVIVVALGVIVLSPLLAVLALLFGLAGLLARGPDAEPAAAVVRGGLVHRGDRHAARAAGAVGHQRVRRAAAHRALPDPALRGRPVSSWTALYRGVERTYGLRVEVEEPELTAEERVARLARPVIVLSRHAGPGDSFLLVHQLLSVYGRRPRVVMTATLQFDPSLDVMGNRLPNVFIHGRQSGREHLHRPDRAPGPRA